MNSNNQPAKPLRVDWKTLVVLAAILAIGGYQWYTGELTGDDPAVVTAPAESSTNSTVSDSDADARQNSKTDLEPAGNYLVPGKGKNLRSPAGLIYTGGRNEHRADHVLRHAQDQPERAGPHGVFDANGDDVFRLIDEAYELIKTDSRQVKTTPEGKGKVEYVVDMNRRIGYLGGQTGNRKNHPPLNKVKLVLGDNRVVTAFPF